MFDKSRAKAEWSSVRAPGTGGFSVIADGVTISGNIVAGNDVQIDGHVEGDVQCAHLAIGETGRVTGAINADALVVAGKVDGPITVTRLDLQGSAQITGDVNYQELKIALGAKISGKLHWVQDRGLKLVTSEQTA